MVERFQRFDRTNKNTPIRKGTNMKQAKPASKSLSLPKPIAAYFAADGGDGEAVSQCFTDNAVVKDEGHTHKGRAAIKEWKTVVTSHLVGNFPGSPVDLRFFFKLEGDKIASLEIIP